MGRVIHEALVVDDNERWLRTLARLVSYFGYSVSTAQTYDEALELTRSDSPPNLLIVDVRLQDDNKENIDGLRLIQEMKESGRLQKSIVVTGYPTREIHQAAKDLGCGYLEKGAFFSIDDFRLVMEEVEQESPNGSRHSSGL
jgi:ActR/RegA family two-component response regulator